jgi:uncharacterized protein (DUF362 family)
MEGIIVSLVSFVKTERSNMKRRIEDSLDLINYKFQKNIENVVVKPNMCYYWDYSTGQTTDPRFVAALIEILREKISPDIDISIVESDASAMKCKYAFKFLDYEKMAKNHNVRLVNLSEDKSEKVEVTVGNEHFHFMIPQPIKNADLRVNIPKIKYLTQTKISCALKNIFGCNPEPKKFKYHPKLDEAIVALNKIMKFNLCILDGLIVSGSQPTRLGLIMASQDPVALDAAATKIAGVNLRSIRHIMLANKEGLGNILFIPKGDNPDSFARRFPKKKLKDKLLSSAYRFATWTGLLDVEML